MGAQFKLRHANIIAYITSRTSSTPRIPVRDLQEFLEALAVPHSDRLIHEDYPLRYGRGGGRSPSPGRSPRGDTGNWSKVTADAAARALSEGNFGEQSESSFVRSPEKVLSEIRSLFSSFAIYGLAVGDGHSRARELARQPTHSQFLLLIPEEEPHQQRNLEFLDVAPAITPILRSAGNWPGVGFWTQTGVAAFAPSSDVDELFYLISRALHDAFRGFPAGGAVPELDDILREWSERHQVRNRRVLQISDLHFGSKHAIHSQGILEAELREVVTAVDRVVVTGDLLDTPKEENASAFRTFKNQLTHISNGTEPIVIPGNHDQRFMGILGENYKHLFEISRTGVIVDDAARMVFACFNSSAAGRLARGRITNRQLLAIGADYKNHRTARPEVARYLPIVLVHHHPFSFDLPPETITQKLLAAFGIRDESLLEMADAHLLHYWCADWKIGAILHGHKHRARYQQHSVGRPNEASHQLTSIGCGSSLGAEGSPLSYNIVEWDSGSRRWLARFFQSDNGGDFREITTTVSPVLSESTPE